MFKIPIQKIITRKRFILAVVLTALIVVAAGIVWTKFLQNSGWETYRGSNISFAYPESWGFHPCSDDKPTFRLNEKILGVEKKEKMLAIEGNFLDECHRSKKLQVTANQEAKNCKLENQGEKLRNGLYIEKFYNLNWPKYITSISISSAGCSNAHILFSFILRDPSSEKAYVAETAQYGDSPRVKEDDFLASDQYKQIKQFAESIKLEKN